MTLAPVTHSRRRSRMCALSHCSSTQRARYAAACTSHTAYSLTKILSCHGRPRGASHCAQSAILKSAYGSVSDMLSHSIFSCGAVIIIRQCCVALCSFRRHILIRQCFSSGISSHEGSHRLAASRSPRGSDSRQPLRGTRLVSTVVFTTVAFLAGVSQLAVLNCFF